MKTQTFMVNADCAVQVDTISSDVTVFGWPELQVQVEIPDDEQPVVEHNSGRLRINGLTLGEAVIRIKVPQSGQLRVNTVSGDISCKQVSGTLAFATTSGDISVEGASGQVAAHTVSGDVRLRSPKFAGLAVETVSGDIAVAGAMEQQGEYSLRTISGDITLQMPPEQGCSVLFHTLSGDFNCTLPHQVRRQGWGRLEAAVNDGGAALRCSSTSGSLTIKGGEADSGRPAQQHGAPAEPKPTRPLNEPFTVEEIPGSRSGARTYTTRMEVLKAIDEGKLSVSEGLALLQKLG